MSDYILTCNAGSNSLKSALYAADGDDVTCAYRFLIDRIHKSPDVTVKDEQGETMVDEKDIGTGYHNALSWITDYLENKIDNFSLSAAGHRIVHGGPYYNGPVVIDDGVRDKLETLVPFAPSHQPHNLALIDALESALGNIPQVACFDTSFHITQSWESKNYALPRDLVEKHKLYRYGFHGLSYDYIADMLKGELDEDRRRRVVALHLGGGASGCAMENGQSVSTTMGLTALEGLMMSTRPGSIDPGILLYLIKDAGLDVDEVEEILYKKSGLLGVSGISRDMRDLDHNDDPRAVEAVTLFCAMTARQTASLATDIGGLDALVFTGAMGAGDAVVREQICDRLTWLGLDLDKPANDQDARIISTSDSAVTVMAMPTDEEIVIARKTRDMLTALESNASASDAAA